MRLEFLDFLLFFEDVKNKRKIECRKDWRKYVVFFFLSQQFITQGVMAVCAYRRNYVWSINTLTFLCSYPIQRTTKKLNP